MGDLQLPSLVALDEFLAVCRRHGVIRVEVPGLKVDLAPVYDAKSAEGQEEDKPTGDDLDVYDKLTGGDDGN